MRYLIILPIFALAACGDKIPPAIPGEHVVYQPVNVSVPRPCPVTVPARPTPLAKPLPTDTGALLDELTAKLLEWAGPGEYGDQADAALKVCTAP